MATATLASLQNMRKELVNSKYYLNIRSGYMAPVTLHCSYGDSGETITFYIFDGGDELNLTGSSASIHGTRRDGASFGPFNCTVSENAVSFTLASTMTAVEGGGIAEILFSKNGTSIGSCNFGIMVEDAVFPNGVAYDSDPSVYQDILKYVQSNFGVLTANYTQLVADEANARAAADTEHTRQIAVERARIDTYLSSGTAATDSELIDIRVKTDGTTAASAGNAVREQISSLERAFYNVPNVVYTAANCTDGKYLHKNGSIANYSGWSISEFLRIDDRAIFYYPNANYSESVSAWFLDSSKSFISYFYLRYQGINVITAPANAVYVRFSIPTTDKDLFWYRAPVWKNFKVLPENLASFTKTDTYMNDIMSGYHYDTSGELVEGSAWMATKKYAVSTGDQVHIYKPGFNVTNYAWCFCFDRNQNFIKLIQDNYYSENLTYVVEENVKYIALNLLAANANTYQCDINGVELGSKYQYTWLEGTGESTAVASIWKDKNYISHGDSITWQDGKAYVQGSQLGQIAIGYQTLFNNAVGLGYYANRGMSGWSMAVVNGNGIVNKIKEESSYSSYDLVTIACGTNDFKLNVPLGSLGVIGDTSFNDATFYGAYRDSIEYILKSSPTVRIVLMTPLQRDNSGYDVNYTNSAGHKLIDYVNAVKNLGQMYGLPVCDMYANSGITKLTLNTYTMDGLHPNDTGYKRMAGYLISFLNSVGN